MHSNHTRQGQGRPQHLWWERLGRDGKQGGACGRAALPCVRQRHGLCTTQMDATCIAGTLGHTGQGSEILSNLSRQSIMCA